MSRLVSSRLVSSRLVSSRLVPSSAILTSLNLLLVSTSCDAPEHEEVSTTPSTFRSEPLPDVSCDPGLDCENDAQYLHPFQNVELVDGKIPLLDIKDSPNGKRYMVLSSVYQEADQASIERFSGVVEVEREDLAPDQAPQLPPFPPVPASKIGGTLSAAIADALDSGEGAQPVRFLLSVDRPSSETITQQLDRAIALGQIQTYADRRAARATLVQQRMLEIEQDMEPVAASITALGGSIVSHCTMAHCLHVEAPFDLVTTIADVPGVARLDRSTASLDSHDPNYSTYIDGNWIREIHQFEQFWAAGHTGENGSSPAIVVAMYDQEQPMTTHLGFRDYGYPNPPWYHLGPSRVLGNFACDPFVNPPCDEGAYQQPTAGAPHGTAVAGILFGDLTDGQFASVTDPTERARRSGYAPEARAWVYTNSVSAQGQLYDAVWDHAAARDPQPSVFIQSRTEFRFDEQCLGEDVLSRHANESLYETGVFHINSAGNDGPGSSTDCKVKAPGSAIGTFTVGAHAAETSVSDFCEARDVELATYSPWGGSPTVYSEGKLRSVIDLTAYAPQEYRFEPDGGTGGFFSGTSAAAPTIAAAAVDLIDVFHTTWWSSAIDDPGVLFVNMLMQGDRQGQQGVFLDEGFDHRWGAGRMRLRMVSEAGMDAPAYYATGWTCVDHLETITWDGNALAGPVGTAIPSDAEAFKAVIWWYDRRHETGGGVDKLKLVLRKPNGQVIRTSDSDDNKQMVYYDKASQVGFLDVVGQSVSSDLEGCGFNSMKVFVAWAFEDSDRDDADGPVWDAQTCEGVEPW